MIIIGEKINSVRKPVFTAIESRDRKYIQKEAQMQSESGADYIDVSASAFKDQEAACLMWLIEVVQEVTDIPLSIDTPDPVVVKKVLPLVKKPPMINSVTLDPSHLEGILPWARDYDCAVIGLCQTRKRMGKTAAEKTEMAGQLIEKVSSSGIDIKKLYIDPLVFPVGADFKSAAAALNAIGQIMGSYTGVHTVCGLTNVSYGLPNGKLINRTFLVQALSLGLDSAILDPTDRQLIGALRAAWMLLGKDDYCAQYLKAFRQGLIE